VVGLSQHYDLGVLFVHGIGDQQQNSTLSRFGGSLQRWLRRWYVVDTTEPAPRAEQIAPQSMVEVTGVRRRTPDGDTPAHASLLVRRPADPGAGEPELRQRWLLAEGWWAAEVSPPSFKAFNRWVLPLLPWVAAEYAIAAARPPGPQPDELGEPANDRKGSKKRVEGEPEPTMRKRPRNRFEKLLERPSLAGLLWLLSPVLALLAMLGCIALALVQQLPVIGKRVNAITANLVKGVGDAYLFAFDGLARAAMVQRIRRNLDWLNNDEQSCRRVAIVAHSQGAALCHDLLRSGALRPDDPVDLFVTVGSGVRRLNVFRELHEDAKLRSLGWTSIAGLVALVAGLVLLLGGLGLPGMAGMGARAGGLAILAGCLVAQPARSSWLLALILAVLGAATLLVTGLLVGGWPGARLGASALAMLTGVGLYAWAANQVLEHVRKVPRLALPGESVRRWVDFYSTADPVPNGPVQTWPDTEKEQPPPPPAVHPTPRLVYNLRSVQADHSYYPDNTDEFVAELASELAATAGLAAEPATVADPRVAEELEAAAERPGGRWPLVHSARLLEARARRRWRTSCRSNARNLLLVSGLLGAVAITLKLGGRGWDGLGADVGVGTQDQPGNAFGQLALWAQEWLAKLPVVGGLADELPLQYLAGVLLAAAVVVASALLLGRLWSIWDSNDVDRFFLRDRDQPLGAWRTHWPSWAFLGLTGSLVLGIMATVDAYTDRGGTIVVAALAAALLFTAALVWVRWRTSLDETGADRQAAGEGGRQELDQGADDLLDGGWSERLEPGDPAGHDRAGDLGREQRGAKVEVGDPEGVG
jgi:hypothetical protein